MKNSFKGCFLRLCSGEHFLTLSPCFCTMLLLLYRNSQTWPEQLSPISESSQCQKLERWLWSQQPKEIILPFCYKAEAGLCSETHFEGGRVLPWSYSSDVLVAHTCNNQLFCAAGFRLTLGEELGAFLWMPIAHLVFHPACNLQVLVTCVAA